MGNRLILETGLIGSIIDDRYKIDRVIGVGGMGTVFAALDSLLNRQVAIKILSITTPGSSRREKLLEAKQPLDKVVVEQGPRDSRMIDVQEVHEPRAEAVGTGAGLPGDRHEGCGAIRWSRGSVRLRHPR